MLDALTARHIRPCLHRRQRAMRLGMVAALLLGWFALTFPSGLAVYFITSNLLGIFQYAMQGKANWRNLLPGGNKQPQIQAPKKTK